MRIARALRTVAVTLLALAATAGSTRADEPAAPTLAALEKTVEDGAVDDRAREAAARAIAESHFAPEELVPWLRARLEKEKAFHVWVATAYALAAQGEVDGLRGLVQSLEQTGHLGYVFLTRVSGEDFGNSDVGWNKPAWDKWVAALDPAAWKELQRQKHLKREPLDGDEAGFQAAIAWWDALGYPDVKTLPFVRVRLAWERVDTGSSFGFLVREDETTFTVFTTGLAESTHSKREAENQEHGRFERDDIEKDVAAALGAETKDRFSVELPEPSVLGSGWGSHATRSREFVIARALAARGAKDLALRLWKRIAAVAPYLPKYGPWSALDALKEDAKRDARRAWEESLADPGQTWAQSLAALRRWRARFDSEGKAGAEEALLAQMAADEAAASTPGTADAKDRAQALVRSLPSVTRVAYYTDSTIHSRYDQDGGGKDAFDELVALGYDAVPALRMALSDLRFTRCRARYVGFTSLGISPEPRPVLVRELALLALRQIAQRDFEPEPAPWETDWPAIAAQVDAWWTALQKDGEASVLRRGVLARDDSSVSQARVLVERHPAEALAPIAEATKGASLWIHTALLETLEPLARPDVQAFLEKEAHSDAIGVRAAAATTLHRQGRRAEIERLVAEWPALLAKIDDDSFPRNRDAPRALLELLLEREPQSALRRVRETLDQVDSKARHTIVDCISRALEREPDAEAILATLVLDERVREEREFTPAALEAQSLGEWAARKAAEVWPERYSFSGDAPWRDRLLARHRIVATWRVAMHMPALPAPEFVSADAVHAEQADPLVAAWLAARDDAERARAEAAIVDAGVGILPSLERSLASLSTSDPRRDALDRFVRRVATIVREIVWSPKGPRPNAALTTYVDATRRRPITGPWITGLWRQVAIDMPEGASGIEFLLTRVGDGTGATLWLELTTATVPWRNGAGDWVLAESGWELVDAPDLRNANSWWHRSRGPQYDAAILVPADKELRLHPTIAGAR